MCDEKPLDDDVPTLYRWVNAEEGGPWVDTDEMRQELIEDGVLVPVEPIPIAECWDRRNCCIHGWLVEVTDSDPLPSTASQHSGVGTMSQTDNTPWVTDND